jgi:hypothetical protein
VEVRDVIASVAPQAGLLLLRQSFLARLPSWTIDNQRHLLVVGGSPTLGVTTLTPRSDELVQTSNWRSVGKTFDGKADALVDVSSIRVAGRIRCVWSKQVFSPPVQIYVVNTTDKGTSYWLSRHAFACDEEVWRKESLTIYYTDGTNCDQPATTSPSPWIPIRPDSVIYGEIQLVCAGM